MSEPVAIQVVEGDLRFDLAVGLGWQTFRIRGDALAALSGEVDEDFGRVAVFKRHQQHIVQVALGCLAYGAAGDEVLLTADMVCGAHRGA